MQFAHVRPLGLILVAAFLAASCTTRAPVAAGTPCDAGNFTVADDFAGARRGTCTVLGKDRVRLAIEREDDAVSNPSPWFAFRIDPEHSAGATITLDYGTWRHRYAPKLSTDGHRWTPLPDEHVSVSADGHTATLDIAVGDEPLFVSAQEILTLEDYERWIESTVVTTGTAAVSELGTSAEGRPIYLLDGVSPSEDVVLLVGRQHPPEVSGAFAFFAFWETVFGNSALAEEFRDRYRVLALPLLNPDGVAAGHWRHNLGRTDLNRDWGPFTQPETRLVESLLDTFDGNGFRFRAFVDFHSTDRNLFYTQVDEDVTDPAGFSRGWLNAAASRVQGYDFTNEDRPTSDTANGKNYMYKRYGIPSVTYEVGDETDRDRTAAAAVVFAEEFMRRLLATPAD